MVWFDRSTPLDEVTPQDEIKLLHEYDSDDDIPAPIASRSSTRRAIAASLMVKRALKQLGYFLLPSFLHHETRDSANKVGELKSSTEYLDGLRGLASLIVFNSHYVTMLYRVARQGYGYNGNDDIWLLPIFRVLYAGAAMVAVFFVLSGFVLTHRFIRKMHAFEYESLYAGLTSLAFRRPVRLFLPSLISAIMTYILTDMGLLQQPKILRGKPFVHGIPAFIDFLDSHTNPLTWQYDMGFRYNAQIWSIGVEYRGSMVVFLMVLILARSTTLARLGIEGLSVVYAFGHRRWDVALFVAGMILAEIDVLVSASTSMTKFVRKRSFRFVMTISLMLGIYLLSIPPDSPAETPGFTFLQHVWPFGLYRRRFWLSVGAILVCVPIQFLPSIQRVFSTRTARYFGRISYALYLVHAATNHVIAEPIAVFLGPLIGDNIYERSLSPLGFVLLTIIFFPITFWVSDVFWRAIDIPCTHFAKWLENKCFERRP